MEPANKPPVNPATKTGKPDIEFLPDADEIELRPLPAFARITLPVLVTALVVAIIWASFSKIDEVVVANGRLINPGGNIVVQPLETSIVQSIDVQVGQVVRKGERLATLDPTFAQADEQTLRAKLRSLTTQSEGLTTELSGANGASAKNADADALLQSRLSAERRANYQAQLDKIGQDVARLRAQLETNRHDQEALAAQLVPLVEMEAMQQKLVDQQYGARIQLLQARDRRLQVERELTTARNREPEIRRELSAQEAQRTAFSNGWRQKAMEDMLTINRERTDVGEQLAKADKRHQLVSLTAPADAVVLEIGKFSQGTIVREAEPVFTLVPLSSALEAEVQIDSLDVGYIKRGDKVHVKIDAFPYQRHGDIEATVRTISEDSFKRESTQEKGLDSYYLSRLSLGQAKLKSMTPQARLLPGMTLKAEIVVGKRSVMSYIVWPLTKALNESVREP
jgi:HlyD family secretion protein